MKNKIVLSLAFLFGGVVFCYATPKTIKSGRSYPKDPSQLVSDNVFTSSAVCPSAAGIIIISTRATQLERIHVSSPTIGIAHFSVYDASVTTNPASNAIIRGQQYMTNARFDWEFNLGFSSGIIIDLQSPSGEYPCLNIINREE